MMDGLTETTTTNSLKLNKNSLVAQLVARLSYGLNITERNQEPIYKDNVLAGQDLNLAHIEFLTFECAKTQTQKTIANSHKVANSFTPNMKEPCGNIFSELGIDNIEGYAHETN